MPIDPVTSEIIRAAFNAAAERMKVMLTRTAQSIIISETLDFGCAIFDQNAQMIAQAIGVPLFQGHLGFPIEATVRARGLADVRPEDIFIHNDSYDGNGNHLNDVAMFMPVFDDVNLVGWVCVKAHWVDIGGGVPTSIQVGSTDIRQEGLRFHAIKLYSAGALNQDVMRLIQWNVRPETGVLADVEAIVGVCRAGKRLFQEILAKYGADVVQEAVRLFMDQSERRTRAALARIPAGSYRASGDFDNDGIDLEQPVRIEVCVTVRDGAMTVDCTGSSPQVKGPFNCGAPITTSAARLLLKCLTTPDEPADEGCFRPLEVRIPGNCVLAASDPAPTGRYIIPVLMFWEVLLKAVAGALPDRVPAGSYGDHMPILMVGRHDSSGGVFIQGDFLPGGAGARPEADGPSALIAFPGNTARNNPVEVVETRIRAMRILRYALRCDSGGRGKFRGGLGVERAYQFTTEVFGTFTLERKVQPPWGVGGGESGESNSITITDRQGSSRSVRKATRHRIAPGEVMTVSSGGGGGYGRREERQAASIHSDVEDGYISEAAARAGCC